MALWGGIETGLMHSGSAFHLFLSCDMPFVSEQTLKDLIAITQDHQTVVCMEDKGRRGFPLVVPDHFLPLVKSQLDQGRRSLYSLFIIPSPSCFAGKKRIGWSQ